MIDQRKSSTDNGLGDKRVGIGFLLMWKRVLTIPLVFTVTDKVRVGLRIVTLVFLIAPSP